MNGLRIIIASIFLFNAGTVFAQEDLGHTYFVQDSLVHAYSDQGDFEPMHRAVEKQLTFIFENGFADSAYKYTYYLGRSISEQLGYPTGIVETEAFVAKVLATDPNISHQLTALSDMSWIYIEAGNDSMCMDTDLRYYALCKSYPNASPEEKYLANYALGFDYELLGKSKEAIHYFAESITAVIADSLNLLSQIMDGYNGLGAAYWRNGNLTQAKTAYEESIRFSRYSTDSLDAFMYRANAFGNLSLVYEDEGNLVKSKELLEHALRIRQTAIAGQKEVYQRTQQTRQLIGNYHNLSALYLQLGDLERSRKAQTYCESLRKSHFPPNHHDHAKSYEAFGSIDFALGDYESALANFEEGLKQLSFGFNANSPYIITVKQRLGKTHNALGNFDESISYLSQAIQSIISISDALTNQELAMAYYARSQPYFEKGELDKAQQDLFRAQSIFEKTRDASNYMFGQIFLDLARIKESKNEIDSAHYYLDKVLSLGTAMEEGKNAKVTNRIQYLPAAYGAKALLIKKSGNSNLEEALEFALTGKDILRHARQAHREEYSQLALYEQQSAIFDIAIDLAFELYTTSKKQKYLNLLLQLAEESKSILLRNQLNKFTSLRVNNVPDSLLILERKLLGTISGLNDEATPDLILKAERDYETLVALFAIEYPEYYALRYNDDVANISEIQDNLLGEKQNLIEFIITKAHTYAIVINAQSAMAVLLETEDILNDIEKYNALITTQSPELFATSSLLYQRLFAPIENYLIGNEIYIVADKGLFNINFEALTNNSDAQAPKYLIETYNISYLLSSTTALQFDQLESTSNSGVLAFAPGFTDKMKASYLAHLSDSVFIDDQYLTSIQQPFSVSSAQFVANIFSGKAMVTEDATETNFKKMADQYAIIHLSTHTEINNLSPLMSKFVLAKQYGDSTNQDGYLHAYEIYNLPLRAELAVLTACETGIGKETSSEGVLSIAHSFAYAGCPSIVMSIWQIDEKTSAEIIANFYSFLKQGKQKNDALRLAKLAYLENNEGELRHPYYWSGLVLVGNTNQISVNTGFPWLMLVATLLLALIGWFAYTRIRAKR